MVHLRYSLFPANTILKMILVTQFAYFASLQKPPFEEFSCVLLFLLRLWRLLLVADNQCTEGSRVPGDQGYYIPHPLPYPGYPSTTGHTTLLHTPGLQMQIFFYFFFISDNMCFWAKAWNTATLCQCSLFNETRHCISAVPTNSCSVPANISLCTMGKDWSGEGEGPGEEGLRWYPVLPTPAAKQDTDNPSFMYEGSLCPPSKANMIMLNMNPVSVACAVLDKSLMELSSPCLSSHQTICAVWGFWREQPSCALVWFWHWLDKS